MSLTFLVLGTIENILNILSYLAFLFAFGVYQAPFLVSLFSTSVHIFSTKLAKLWALMCVFIAKFHILVFFIL